MNKREKDAMINLVVALDNLYVLTENIEDLLTKDMIVETQFIKNIKNYKNKIIDNLNVIEETKDFLLGITQLKISSERFNISFI